MQKLAIAVNYGGPIYGREKDYLKRLFSDEVLFPLPKPLRLLTGFLVSNLRWRETREILETLGGKSPLLEQTEEQVLELSKLLKDWELKAAMRYSEPLLEEILKTIDFEKYKEVVVFPLFPHYSVATYGTIERVVENLKLKGEVKFAKPFYDCEGFITGWVKETEKYLKSLNSPILLFSAHSLPLYLVEKFKDPYPLQVEKSAKLIAERLNLPYKVSYQSKLGPVKWLEPSTKEVLRKLSKRRYKEVVVIPISFVSENSETLWEIDINYSNLAKELGIEKFVRVKIPYKSPHWLECWKKLIIEAEWETTTRSE